MNNMKINILKLIFCTSVLASCSTTESGQQEADTPSLSTESGYEITAVERDRPQHTVQLPGELRPYETAEIHAKMRGFIKKLYVDIGDHVQEGQLLAEIEAPELALDNEADQANQQKLLTQYKFSKQAYERLKNASDSKRGSIADLELERAYSTLISDSAAYASATTLTRRSSKIHEYLRIRAPFSGNIVQRNISVGALVGDGQSTPLFSIAKNDKLRLAVAVPEIHANSVYPGMESNFTVMSYPNREFTALLSRDSRVLNSTDRSLNLEFDVDNKEGILRGGDYAEVKIPLHRADSTYFVNSKSVINTQRGTFILKVDNESKVEWVQVRTGIQTPQSTEVFGNLNVGDRIILHATEEITDGQNITIQ